MYGDYSSAQTSTSVNLNVLCQTGATSSPNHITLLNNITNPRIVVPQQELTFDSTDPFFISDVSRTYLVLPEFQTLGNSPEPLENLAYVNQWSTQYVFQTFYHPYARTFLRELEIGGVSAAYVARAPARPANGQGLGGASPTPTSTSTRFMGPQNYVATPFPGASSATAYLP